MTSLSERCVPLALRAQLGQLPRTRHRRSRIAFSPRAVVFEPAPRLMLL